MHSSVNRVQRIGEIFSVQNQMKGADFSVLTFKIAPFALAFFECNQAGVKKPDRRAQASKASGQWEAGFSPGRVKPKPWPAS